MQVVSGDSITSVAAKFDLTPTRLCQINKLQSHHLFVGQHLKVITEEHESDKVKESNPESNDEFKDNQGMVSVSTRMCPFWRTAIPNIRIDESVISQP